MYLMHSKENAEKKNMRCDQREMLSMTENKHGNNYNKNEYTKKCEKYGVECIYHIRLADKCS